MEKQMNLIVIFLCGVVLLFGLYKGIQMRKIEPYVNPMSLEAVWKHEKDKQLPPIDQRIKENERLLDSLGKEINKSVIKIFHDRTDKQYGSSYHGKRHFAPGKELLDSLKKDNNKFLYPFNIKIDFSSEWESPLNVPYYGMTDGVQGFLFNLHSKDIFLFELPSHYGKDNYQINVIDTEGNPVDFPSSVRVELTKEDKQKYGYLYKAREEYLKASSEISNKK